MKFESQIKTSIEKGVQKVFDPVRKKWFIASPEELVRQSIIQYLLKVVKIPISLLDVEFYRSLPQGSHRFDIIAWEKTSTELIPWLLVECKSPHVSFNISVQSQIQKYLILYPSKFVMLSNSKTTYFWEKKTDQYQPISALPTYKKFNEF